MQLQIEPLLDTDLCDALYVSGPGTECQPVQRMDGAFAVVHCSGELIFFPGGELCSRAGEEQQYAGNGEMAAMKRHSRTH